MGGVPRSEWSVVLCLRCERGVADRVIDSHGATAVDQRREAVGRVPTVDLPGACARVDAGDLEALGADDLDAHTPSKVGSGRNRREEAVFMREMRGDAGRCRTWLYVFRTTRPEPSWPEAVPSRKP